MQTAEQTIIKLAVLNDLMELELSNIKIDTILEAPVKCKLKNAKKNAEILTRQFDEMMGDAKKSEFFGDLCDYVNKIIDKTLNPDE